MDLNEWTHGWTVGAVLVCLGLEDGSCRLSCTIPRGSVGAFELDFLFVLVCASLSGGLLRFHL